MSTSTYYQGYEGSVRFNATGGTAAILTAVKSWTMTVRKEILERTPVGEVYRQAFGGTISGSGSIELIYNGENNDFIEAVNSSNDLGNALFELYLTGSKRIVFNGLIEEATYGSSPDDVQVISCSYITNGTISLEL